VDEGVRTWDEGKVCIEQMDRLAYSSLRVIS